MTGSQLVDRGDARLPQAEIKQQDLSAETFYAINRQRLCAEPCLSKKRKIASVSFFFLGFLMARGNLAICG